MTEHMQNGAGVEVLSESPLKYVTAKVVKKGGSACGVAINEAPIKGHLNLRGNPEDEQFRRGVEQVLGVELPVVPCTCVANATSSVYWLGPNEWLVIVDGGTEVAVEAQLRATLSGHFAVVDLSGGQTLVHLSGEAVQMVLKKSSGYDFSVGHFPVGRCVQTTFAKATALVSRTGDDAFDLVIRRSFSDYLFRWIMDAADEYGIEVEN
jgi:sarcosine oxidase subunit gamma